MSHFTVLVIGDNQEEQLAPFEEELGTNPKWDWYQLGGRWTGFFKLKEGQTGDLGEVGILTEPAEDGWVDQALKGDIDFEGMRDIAAAKALERWDAADALLINDLRASFIPWKTMLEKHGDDIDRARNLYHNQPAIFALQKDERFSWNFENVFCTREEMEARARANAITTFAVLKDGVWYERGEMNWWAIVTDEKDEDSWNNEFNKLIDGLPDDTLLSMFDCHI